MMNYTLKQVNRAEQPKILAKKAIAVWRMHAQMGLQPRPLGTAPILETPELVAQQIMASAVQPDPITHPPHYHAGSMEAIEVIEAFAAGNFHRGNALKYLMRAGRKGDAAEDLRKAIWYIEREIARLGEGH